MKEKKKISILLGVLFVAIALTVGVTYALWQIVLQQTDTNVITTGCFDIRLLEDETYNGITLTNAYPISDEEGLMGDPYRFTVKNNCSEKALFYLNLETITNSEKPLNEKYLKASLKTGEESLFLDTLNDSYQNEEKVIAESQKAIKLYEKSLNKNEEITFELRIWMDEETPAIDEVMNATYSGKITLSSNYVQKVENLMMAMEHEEDEVYINYGGGAGGDYYYYVTNTTYTQNGKYSYLATVVFQDTINPYENAEEIVDFSEAQDGSVLGYYVKNDPEKEYLGYTLYIQADGKIKVNPDASYYGFVDSFYKTEYIGIENFDTSLVTDMSYMFYNGDDSPDGLSSATSLDVSHFDTSKVTNMGSMFRGMSSLTDLDLSNFDTSNVTDMSGMFNNMESLTNLDISSFDTSKVTDMSFMFGRCSRLTVLDVSHFITSKVTNMSFMFSGMVNLTSLNLGDKFDTSKVTNMSEMFAHCGDLTTIIYGDHFVRKSGSFIDRMFNNCPANRPTHESWNGVTY